MELSIAAIIVLCCVSLHATAPSRRLGHNTATTSPATTTTTSPATTTTTTQLKFNNRVTDHDEIKIKSPGHQRSQREGEREKERKRGRKRGYLGKRNEVTEVHSKFVPFHSVFAGNCGKVTHYISGSIAHTFLKYLCPCYHSWTYITTNF